MDTIRPCQSYAAHPSGRALYRNGPHAFKIYYVDIHGRPAPEQYEWDRSGRDKDGLLAGLKRAGVEGVGFVIAFPHIAKVFRWAPSIETVLHVRAYRPADFSELPLGREEGYVEYACLAESIIGDGESRLWAHAASVDAYLGEWVDWAPAAIADPAKLARYFSTR